MPNQTKKPVEKRPFLRRGTGLARYDFVALYCRDIYYVKYLWSGEKVRDIYYAKYYGKGGGEMVSRGKEIKLGVREKKLKWGKKKEEKLH